MRLSLKKDAHAVLSRAASRKFGVSAWFWQMWDSEKPAHDCAGVAKPVGCPTLLKAPEPLNLAETYESKPSTTHLPARSGATSLESHIWQNRSSCNCFRISRV